MLNQSLVIARKEIVDGLRDVRSVISALLYALMGPLVVGLVSLSNRAGLEPALIGMMSVFTLVAAFVGGMNVAMDTVAGERERRSLLPLLLNPVRRIDVAAGKWLAVSFFSIAGLTINLLGFAVVIGTAGIHANKAWWTIAVGIFPLALLAASIQLLISTVCKALKEAQTYLSLIVFLPMGIGMFLVFYPAAARGWCKVLPVLGQELQLEGMMKGAEIRMLEPVALGLFTAALAILVLLATANRMQRDEIVCGH